MPAELPHLLLRGESGGRLPYAADVRSGQERCIKDHVKVLHQLLHHQCLVGVIHQGGQGHLRICVLRLHQRGAKDDAKVARGHLVLLGLLADSVVVRER